MKSNRQGKTWAAAAAICAALAGLWLLGRSEPREEVPEPSALPPARPEGDGETAPGQKLRDALRRTAQTRQTLEAALARAEGTGGATDAAEACRLFQLSTYQLLGPTLLPVFPAVGLNPDEGLEELVRQRAEAGDPSAQAARLSSLCIAESLAKRRRHSSLWRSGETFMRACCWAIA